MTAGKPAAQAYKQASIVRVYQNRYFNEGLQELTPGHRMIDARLVFDVVNLNNKQVKIDSLDEHPTESCYQKVLQKSGYSNTSTL